MKKYLEDKIKNIKLPYSNLEVKQNELSLISTEIQKLEIFTKLLKTEDYLSVIENINDVLRLLKFDNDLCEEIILILKLKAAIKKGATIKISSNQEAIYEKFKEEIINKIDYMTELYCKMSDEYNLEFVKMGQSAKIVEKYEEWLSIYLSYADTLDLKLIEIIRDDPSLSSKRKFALFSDIAIFNERIFSNYKKMSKEEFKSLLPEFADNKHYSQKIESILTKYSYDELKEILEYMDEKNLRFSDKVLINILSIGTTLETVKTSYEMILDKKIRLLSTLEIEAFWTAGKCIISGNTKVNSSLSKGRKANSESLDGDLKLSVNMEQVHKNIELLKSLGLFTSDLAGLKKVIVRPNSLLLKNIKEINLYKLKKTPSTLAASKMIDYCDNYIELGHLAILLKYPSLTVAYPKRFALIKLYQTKNVNYVNDNGSFLENMIYSSSLLKKDVEELYNEAGVRSIPVTKREHYDKYLSENTPDVISSDVTNNELIMYLESNNKRDDYEYVIGNKIISRLKVLRIMEQLLKNPDFNLEESFRYAVFYNAILTEREIEMINKGIDEVLSNVYPDNVLVGGNNGVSI